MPDSKSVEPAIRGDLNRAARCWGLLRGREAVRADRRLRADGKAIRAQSTILDKTLPSPYCFNYNRVFCTDAVYPCRKRGWRAQRATSLLA